MASENTPLLTHFSDEDGHEERPTSSTLQSPNYLDVLVLAFVVLVADTAAFMSIAPLTRLLESAICQDYYKTHETYKHNLAEVPEYMCKINPIQSELAMLKGWSSLLDCLPGLLLALPYGTLADTIGKKPVIVLGLLGGILNYGWVMIVCYFPQTFHYKFAWFSSAFYIVGGGSTVTSSMIMAMIADMVDEGQRSIIFFQLMAVTLVPQFTVMPIASFLMDRNVWLPMFIGLGLMVFDALVMTLSIPRTPVLSSPPLEGNNLQPFPEQTQSTRIFKFLEDSKFIFTSRTVTTLLFTFLANSLGNRALDLLIQYASMRYNWSISKASSLVSLLAIFQLVLLLLILPTVSAFLTNRLGMVAKKKELYICRVSVVLLLLGAIGIGFSVVPTLAIGSIFTYAMGYGFSGSMQSLLTSIVERHQVARLYAAITIMKMIGGVATSPVLSTLLSWGYDAGGIWIGLPFFVCGIIYMVVAVPLCMIRFGL